MAKSWITRKIWKLRVIRRDPYERGGLVVGEVVRIVKIDKKKKIITVIPGSPPAKARRDVFREH